MQNNFLLYSHLFIVKSQNQSINYEKIKKLQYYII
jgi:hypothetical protein